MILKFDANQENIVFHLLDGLIDKGVPCYFGWKWDVNKTGEYRRERERNRQT